MEDNKAISQASPRYGHHPQLKLFPAAEVAAIALVIVFIGNARGQTTLVERESREDRITIVRHEKGTHGFDYSLKQQNPSLPDSAAVTMLIQFKPLYSPTLALIKNALLQRGRLVEYGVERGDTSHTMTARQIDKITKIQAVGLLLSENRPMWVSVQMWAADVPPCTVGAGQVGELKDYFDELWQDYMRAKSLNR